MNDVLDHYTHLRSMKISWPYVKICIHKILINLMENSEVRVLVPGDFQSSTLWVCGIVYMQPSPLNKA